MTQIYWTSRADADLMVMIGKSARLLEISSYSSQVLDDRQEQSWLERPLNRIKRIPPVQPTRIHHAPNRSEQLRTPQ